MQRNKLIVIVGPTASGKTGLAINLARKFRGEIVSADSRQVYKGMDIGTGKDLNEYGKPFDSAALRSGNKKLYRLSLSKAFVPYHLIDIVHPSTNFTLAQYQRRAYKAINSIIERGRVPLLVGGTGLYVYAVVNGYSLPEAQPDPKLRKRLAAMTLPQLLVRLKKLDPVTHATIDKANRRRVERAVEICLQTGKRLSDQRVKNPPPYEILMLGMQRTKEKLYKNIDKRLRERLEQGMVKEVERLHEEGVSWKRLESFGLEYRYVSRYLQSISKLKHAHFVDRQNVREVAHEEYEKMVGELSRAIKDFSRRQMTWFKKDTRIHWVKNKKEATRLVQEFLA